MNKQNTTISLWSCLGIGATIQLITKQWHDVTDSWAISIENYDFWQLILNRSILNSIQIEARSAEVSTQTIKLDFTKWFIFLFVPKSKQKLAN